MREMDSKRIKRGVAGLGAGTVLFSILGALPAVQAISESVERVYLRGFLDSAETRATGPFLPTACDTVLALLRGDTL